MSYFRTGQGKKVVINAKCGLGGHSPSPKGWQPQADGVVLVLATSEILGVPSSKKSANKDVTIHCRSNDMEYMHLNPFETKQFQELKFPISIKLDSMMDDMEYTLEISSGIMQTSRKIIRKGDFIYLVAEKK